MKPETAASLLVILLDCSIGSPALAQPSRVRARAGRAELEPIGHSDAGTRLGPELAGGVLGAVAGSAVGSLFVGAIVAGLASCTDESPRCGSEASLGVFLGLAATSVLLSVPAGVSVAGNAAGGDGSYGASLLGTLVGATAGWVPFGVFLAFTEGAHDAGGVAAVLAGAATITTIAGAIVGFELSTDTGSARATRVALSVSPTRDGGGLLALRIAR